MRRILQSGLLVFCLTLLARGEIQHVSGDPVPNRIRPNVVLLSAKWAAQIPPTGRVNAPEFLSTLYPGQPIAFGLMAEGPDRNKAFDNVRVQARFSSGPGSEKLLRDLKPTAIRQIKAEGADFALDVLKAGGIGQADQIKIGEVTSFVTLAVFTPDWAVPADTTVSDVEILVTVSGSASPVKTEPARLKIRTTADWLKEPPLTPEQVGGLMNRYRGNNSPGQVLSWFRTVAKAGQIKTPAVQAFFAFVFKADTTARDAAVDSYSTLDSDIQLDLLWVLRLAGYDLKALFPALNAETLAPFKAVEPLADPPKLLRFKDPVDVQALAQLGHPMDQCWAAWMATGDKNYLRSLVDLLESADDFPVFKKWQDSRGGAKGLNAKVARGLAYQIAGWSIGSFQRTDPHVADWLLFWQDDPSVSPTTRRELVSLSTNAAFQRK